MWVNFKNVLNFYYSITQGNSWIWLVLFKCQFYILSNGSLLVSTQELIKQWFQFLQSIMSRRAIYDRKIKPLLFLCHIFDLNLILANIYNSSMTFIFIAYGQLDWIALPQLNWFGCSQTQDDWYEAEKFHFPYSDTFLWLLMKTRSGDFMTFLAWGIT